MAAVKQISDSLKKNNILLIVVISFSVLGVYFILKSHAATPNIVWPFDTKSSSQFGRIDGGLDIQSSPGANVYAIAPGTINTYIPDPGAFGNDYPVEQLDYSIGGPTNWVYYGHVHILPGLAGKHVNIGQLIAKANYYDGQNGSHAPQGWLEIGFALPGTDAKQCSAPEGTVTSCGQKMNDLLYQSSVQPISAVTYQPRPSPITALTGGTLYPGSPSCGASTSLGPTLFPGTNLSPNTYLQSSNGQVRLCNHNGYVIEWTYNNSDGHFDNYFWETISSTGGNNYLTVKSDGNLVYGPANGSPLESYGTNGSWNNNSGNLPDTLTLNNEGDLILKNHQGQPVWTSFYGLIPQKAHASSVDGDLYYQCQGSTLYGVYNQYLTNNDCLESPDGTYLMSFSSNGTLNAVDGNNNQYWTPNISALGGTLKVQQDGNLVLYSSTGSVIWSTQTSNSGSGNYLTMQNDGNLVLYTSTNQAIWSIYTGKETPPPINLGPTLYVNQSLYPNEELVSTAGRQNSQYSLILQLDGNLVSYNLSGTKNCNVITFPCSWANSLPSRLTMQSDGNLVFYNYLSQKIWASNTQGTGANDYFVVQGDGNLVVFNSFNQAVWSKNTGRLYPTPPPPPVTVIGSTLGTNQRLYPNQELLSSTGYNLKYQLDGNLVDYNPSGGVVWASGTNGRSLGNLSMQGDGNLVLYNDYGGAMWSTGTYGKGDNNFLILGGDGNFAVETNHGIPVWGLYNGYIPEQPIRTYFNQTNIMYAHQIMTSNQYLANSAYRLVYQSDGNLVEYNTSNQVVWTAHTYGSSVNNLKMQDDGNLVMYNASGGVVWSTGTGGTGGSNYLILQDDGNVVVYTNSGIPKWSWETGRIN